MAYNKKLYRRFTLSYYTSETQALEAAKQWLHVTRIHLHKEFTNHG